MNTQENKARLFAQYWGQKVGVYLDGSPDERSLFEVDEVIVDPIDFNTCLFLKPLSSISDEDAIEVAKILHPNDDHSDKKWISYIIENIPDLVYSFIAEAEELDFSGYTLSQIINTIDYLRSKGYAIPYLCISVEQQIEYRWIKLID